MRDVRETKPGRDENGTGASEAGTKPFEMEFNRRKALSGCIDVMGYVFAGVSVGGVGLLLCC